MEPKIIGLRIKKIIEEKNMDKEDVARKMGITNKELENKLYGKKEFFVDEIIAIKQIFNLTIEECANIFFDEEVTNSDTTK